LEGNTKTGKSNSAKNSPVIKNEEIKDVRMKRFMSVPDNKTHSKRSFSSKKKRNSEILSVKTDTFDVKRGQLTVSCDFPVKETNVMVRDYDPKTGRKMINNYVVVKEVGRGCHGKVKLCYDIDTNEQYVNILYIYITLIFNNIENFQYY